MGLAGKAVGVAVAMLLALSSLGTSVSSAVSADPSSFKKASENNADVSHLSLDGAAEMIKAIQEEIRDLTSIREEVRELRSLQEDVRVLKAQLSALTVDKEPQRDKAEKRSLSDAEVSSNNSIRKRRSLQAYALAADFDLLKAAFDALSARLGCVHSGSTLNAFILDGCNVYIRNGMGRTDSTNSKGNLVIGYSESGSNGATRSGSHNLVVGPRHSWTSYGGLVTGTDNSALAPYASVVGGLDNVASASHTTVVGSQSTSLTGSNSVAVGGTRNSVEASRAVAVGGMYNAVMGPDGLVVGGSRNRVNTNSRSSMIVGGVQNTAWESDNAIVGGYNNVLPARAGVAYAVQVGGKDNGNAAAMDMYDVGVANSRFADA